MGEWEWDFVEFFYILIIFFIYNIYENNFCFFLVNEGFYMYYGDLVLYDNDFGYVDFLVLCNMKECELIYI